MAEAAPLSMVDMDIEIHNFSPVAIWRWNVTEDSCGICMNQFDGTAPGIRFPGDDCAPVFGKCKHTFHMPCLMKWLEQQGKQGRAHTCPLCRADWEFSQYQSPARPLAGRGAHMAQLDFYSEPTSDDSGGSGDGLLPGSEAGGGGVARMADLASIASSMDDGSSAGSISIDSPGSGNRGRAGASSGIAAGGGAAPASGRRGNSVGGARRVSAGQSVRWQDESPDGGARGRSGGAGGQGASEGRRRGRGAADGGEAGPEAGGRARAREGEGEENGGDEEDLDMDMSEDGLDTTEESS